MKELNISTININTIISTINTLGEPWRSIIWLAVILLLALCADLAARKIILSKLRKFSERTATEWDNILVDRGVFRRLARYVPAVLVYFLLPLALPQGEALLTLRRLVLSGVIVVTALFLSSMLNGIAAIYRRYEISKLRPIKGFIQIFQILIYICGLVLAVTTALGVSPLGILSGIGALSAIILLVFRDSILGIIASIQLSVNNQVHIGDWIEVPQFGADGDVVDISLQSVMVRNWDKTIVTLPIYALTSSSFKNWRGMSESGGRRIKRSLHIDMTSIRFLDDDQIQRLQRLPLLREYLKRKEQEIRLHNSGEVSVSRRLTNIGTFRAYVEEYLKFHPHIHDPDSMTCMVRQLPPGPEGLPLEIYAFSREQDWTVYESIQSDILDHLLSILPEFSLSVYQKPGTQDLQMISRSFGARNEEKS